MIFNILILVASVAVLGLGNYLNMTFEKMYVPSDKVQDKLFDLTRGINVYLSRNKEISRKILAINSLCFDIFGSATIIHGTIYRPMMVLAGSTIIVLKACLMYLVGLPIPENMIWFCTGIPSFMVDYSSSADLFFSGHVAHSVYFFLYWCSTADTFCSICCCVFSGLFLLYTMIMLIVMRIHYTMDIYAGLTTGTTIFFLVNNLVK